jgi:ABC-type sugar transport system substrate-binding protein
MKLLVVFLAVAILMGGGSANAYDKPPPGTIQTSYKDVLMKKFGHRPVVGATVLQFNNVTIQRWIGTMKQAAAFHGIDLRVVDGQNDVARQTNQIDTFLAQGVDCVMVDPVDAKGILPVVDRIKAKIPCSINYDTRAPEGADKFQTYVGHDWLVAGIMSGLQIVAATNGKGNVVLVEGSPGTDAQFNRTKGIELVLSQYPDIKIIAKQPGMFNRDQGLRVTEALLQAHSDIDVMYFQNDEMYFGGMKAIEASGRRNQMKILSVDGNPDAMAAIKKGDLDYEVVGQFGLFGWVAVETAARILAGETVPKWVQIKLNMADISNVDVVPPGW